MAYEAFGEEGPRARNDAYTGLLAISFFAMVIACLLLLVDWYGYEGQDNPAKKVLKSLPPVKSVAGAPGPGEIAKPPVKPPEVKKVEDKPVEKVPAKDKMEGKDKMDGKDKMPAKDDKKDDK